MTSKQIWNQANVHRELIRSIYHALCGGGDINDDMDQLKRRVPCLYGVDADRRALVFQSTDAGLVGVLVKEHDDVFALALVDDITLE